VSIFDPIGHQAIRRDELSATAPARASIRACAPTGRLHLGNYYGARKNWVTSAIRDECSLRCRWHNSHHRLRRHVEAAWCKSMTSHRLAGGRTESGVATPVIQFMSRAR